jgi:L-amino acid N-acyltransferase YncA
MLELGMETEPEFRRKGFASIITAKLIDYCLERDLEPIWACRDGNKASYNLAVKLGFEPVAYLPYYELAG